MKNSSHRYNINRSKSRHGHKYSKMCPEMFYKKFVLRKFHKNYRKNLFWSLFLNKVSGLLWHRYFPVNFAIILRTHFLVNTSDDYLSQMLPNLKRWRTENTQNKALTGTYSFKLFIVSEKKNVNVICKDLVSWVVRKILCKNCCFLLKYFDENIVKLVIDNAVCG